MDAALAAEREGRFEAAAAQFERILSAHSRHPAASLHLGRVLLRLQRVEDAVPRLRDAASQAHRDPTPSYLLGLALLETHDREAAERALKKALALAPGAVEVLEAIGTCALRSGRPTAAEAYFRKAVACAPGRAGAKQRLAALLAYVGRNGEARRLYLELLCAGTKTPAVFAGLVEASTYAQEPPEYRTIVSLADEARHSPVERRMLHFAAARIDRSLGRRKQEWNHVLAGKSLMQDGFDIGFFAELVSMMTEIVTPAFIAERVAWAHESELPVFIFGMPRSGTSLIEQIIGAHPRAEAGGESPFFNRAMRRLGISTGHAGSSDGSLEKSAERMRSLDLPDVTPLAAAYLARLQTRAGATGRMTDKTPHNFLHLWLIALLFPRARYIHAVRDPLAVCFSCFTTDLMDWHAYSKDLATLARYYRLYEKLMRVWQSVLPVSLAECRYETLASHPEDASRSLVNAAGLEWDEACLGFHRTGRLSLTASHAQVREPIHARRLEAWRDYAAYLGPLLDEFASPARSDAAA